MPEVGELLRQSAPLSDADVCDAVTAVVARDARRTALLRPGAVNDVLHPLLQDGTPEHLILDQSKLDPRLRFEDERDTAELLGHDSRHVFTLYEATEVADAELDAYREFQARQRMTARSAHLPLRLHLIAGRDAFVPLDVLDSSAGAWHVTDPRVVGELRALFVRLWRSADPVPRDGLGRVTLAAVLADLQAGRTDAAAARRRGVSLRTYRRGVADVFDSLGVQTRFQAGVVASRLGLMDLVEEDRGPLAT